MAGPTGIKLPTPAAYYSSKRRDVPLEKLKKNRYHHMAFRLNYVSLFSYLQIDIF